MTATTDRPRLVWLAGQGTGRLKPGRCPGCRTLTLTGQASDWPSPRLTVGPQPLSPTGEALARLAGLTTWTLSRPAGKALISWRDHFAIRRRPAGSGVGLATRQAYDVIAEHRCGLTFPGTESAFNPQENENKKEKGNALFSVDPVDPPF